MDVWRVFWFCPFHLSPLTKMFGVWLTPTSVSATSCLEKKIHGRRRKWVENTRLGGGKPRDWHLVLKTLYCWASDSDSMHSATVEYLGCYFVQQVSPRRWLDLKRVTWENSQARNTICLFAASHIVESSRIYESKAAFPLQTLLIPTALFMQCGASLLSWNWSVLFSTVSVAL